MIIKIKSGGRGRPISLEPEKILKQFQSQLPRAKARLQQIRRETSGTRSESILGSETMLPKSIRATADVIDVLLTNQPIDYATARELKANLRTVSQLASKQERVYGRALASALTKQYEEDIKYASKYASKTTRQIYQRMLARVKALSPVQQQKFFTSRGYQDVKTNTNTYQHTIEWAQNHFKTETGIDQQMTAQEAMAYVMEQRQKEGL